MSTVETVKVLGLETLPSRDAYKGGDAATDVMFWLDPDARTCGVLDWRNDYANAEYYNGLKFHDSVVYDRPDGSKEYPDPKPLREYLTSEIGQATLETICDGWER